MGYSIDKNFICPKDNLVALHYKYDIWHMTVTRSWEANSQVQNVKLGGHQTCLSLNRLWHELCDMLRRLVGTTDPGHQGCSI